MSEKRPLKDYRHGGKDRNVKAAVWENRGAGGQPFLSASFKLQYFDDGEWRDSQSYGVADVYSLIRCATDVVAFMFFDAVRDRDEEKQ